VKLVAADDPKKHEQPEATGISAEGLVGYLNALKVQGLDLHGLLVHQRGYPGVEAYRWPFHGNRPRTWHSIAKAFTATAMCFALEENLFALTDKVVDFFPDDVPPEVSDHLAAMTIRDLLSMRTGHAEETSGSRWRGIKTSWIAEFLKIPVVHPPGDVFVYTSAASYMLSAILTRVTRLTLHEYLRPRLFEPLDIHGETWDVGPDGVNPGGNGLACTIADLLKLGMLYLQKGHWNGKQIVPEARIVEATRPIGDSDYGLHWVTGPDGACFAMGLFGQLIAILPAYETVIVIAGAINRSDGCSGVVVPLLLQHLPSIFPGESKANTRPTELDDYRERLTRPPQLASSAPAPIGLRRYAMAKNSTGIDEIVFHMSRLQCTIELSYSGVLRTIQVGIDRWMEGQTDISGAQIHHGYDAAPATVVAGGRWLSETELEMNWIFPGMTFRDTVLCDFRNKRLLWNRRSNVNSSDVHMPALHGFLIQG
jgi:CubicO group peptidase (beta-lactamase class C family)